MAQKRKLNIPIYNVEEVPEGVFFDDEDVIDVDVLEDTPTLSERMRARAREGAASVSEAVRNVRANGVRDAFFSQPVDFSRSAAGSNDPRIREREVSRRRRMEEQREREGQAAQQRAARRERAALVREARRDPVARLRLDTIRSGEAYAEALKRSGILGSGQTKATQKKQLEGLHQVYASMMALQCVRPLQEGMSAKNIVNVLGMAASMWMLSPEFRTQVGEAIDKVGEAIDEKITARSRKKDDKARTRFEKLSAAGKGDQLEGRWRRRLERIKQAERGYRLPFSTESAAMTHLALAETAYAEMRQPGADSTAVAQRYTDAVSVLYGFVEQDGLNTEEVARSMRVIIGQRLGREPELASVFNELAHGRFTKGEPRTVQVGGSGDVATIWAGDFVDAHEGRVVTGGAFTLRPKMDVTEHRVRIAEVLAMELTDSRTASEMNDALSQYTVAIAAGRHPDIVGEIQDPKAQARFARARTMFSSMAADGLNGEEQRFAYSAAYSDAVEIVQALKPDLAQAWAEQYGSDWRDKVEEEMRFYDNMGAAAGRHGDSAAARDPEQFGTSGSVVVDAEVVEHDADGTSFSRSGRVVHDTPKGLDEPIYEGEVLPIDENEDADLDILEIEPEDLEELDAAQARAAILAGMEGPDSDAEEGSSAARDTEAKIRRARVNQHYNEIDTGRVLGLGRDDAQPLQDVDFQLG